MSAASGNATTVTATAASESRTCSWTLVLVVAAFLAVALAFTWWRLLHGADLVDEAFSVLVPWRWALGDRPFVDEQNLSQSAGLVAYPFVKLFAVLRGNDVTGLVLYERHLYLLFGLVTAGCVYLLARRSVSRALAALVAAPFFTVVLFGTPQLTANTICALSLSAGAALGAVTVLRGPRWCALLAGVAYGVACVAYPTVLLLAPFVAVFLAFSVGDAAVGMAVRGSLASSPAGEGEPSGARAWRALSAWALGGTLVVAPVVVVVLALAGTSNLRRSWDYTIRLARQLDQLGGTSKAVEVSGAFVSLLAHQWYIVLAAVLSLVVFRMRPDAGRWLLLLTPPAFWLTATTSSQGAAGAVIMYSLAAPYLYLFVPRERREDGARLLAWVWAPALLVGAMTAYTSADGFVHAAVGLLPGVAVSGLFLTWGLLPLRRRLDAIPWPAVAALAAVVAATLAFQVQFNHDDARWGDLTARMHDGPWKGIALTPGQRGSLERFSADLRADGEPGDQLLVYPQGAAFYLYWPGEIAANTYQLYVADPQARLPKATVSYYRRHHEVPTLVAHLQDTRGRSEIQLTNESGGLEYPPVTVSPWYALLRKPPGDSVDQVLEGLPRL